MIEVGASGPIKAPVSQVWDVLTQTARIPEWNSAHVAFKGDVPAQLTKDAQYTERYKAMGMSITMNWTARIVEPPSLVEMVGSGPAGLTVTIRYELTGDESATFLTMRSEFAGGPAETAFSGAIRKAGQQVADKAISKLAALLAP